MLAAFATSEHGKLYGRVCQRYGLDPAAVIDDDVLAFNFRLALALGDLPEDDPEPDVSPDGTVRYDGGIR